METPTPWLPEDEDGAPLPAWVLRFVPWAEGHTDILDFEGTEVPERLQALLTALEPPYHVLTTRVGGWNLQHPLECRPNLGDCAYNRFSQRDAEELFVEHGASRWKVERTEPRGSEPGEVRFERLEG